MIAPDDCQSYLQEICCRYKQWWTENALTEAIAVRQATFLFEQMVETEEKSSEGNPRSIPRPIFKGIQNYIESEHILLVGSPGIGKSTTLLRCMVQLAEREREKPEPRIPVLISLKRYNSNRFSCPEDPSGILTLIKDTLEPDLWLEVSDIKKLLFKDKRLILLLDGLNEMSAGEKRTELEEFRKKCVRSQVPLICTTRELGGGDLGIKRKLQIQPLRSEEVERFLQDCIPDQKQKVLQLLNRDNRGLSCTPFVLWMLYDLFQQQDTEVESLAEASRQFFQSFKKYKEGAPISDERRQEWNRWLEHLAFTMLNNPDPTDPGLVISKEQAEKSLIEKFGGLYGASFRIEELLKYHLLEPISEKEISFHHQLIQEYYAAECLLTKLTGLLKKQPEQKYTPFQMNYLNYVKWTEVIALMLGFIEMTEEKALRVIELALEVDLIFGARLAGESKLSIQEKYVDRVTELDIPEWLQVELLEETRARNSVPILLRIIKFHLRYFFEKDGYSKLELIVKIAGSKSELIVKAVRALWKVGDKQIIPDFLEILTDINPNVGGDDYSSEELEFKKRLLTLTAIFSLGMLKSEEALLILTQKFERINTSLSRLCGSDSSEEDHNLRRNYTAYPYCLLEAIATALGGIRSQTSIPTLLEALKASNSKVRAAAAESLGKIGSNQAIPSLRYAALKDPESDVRDNAAYALSTIGAKEPILVRLEIAVLLAVAFSNEPLVRNESLEILFQLTPSSKSFSSGISDAFKKFLPEETDRLLGSLNNSQEDVIESAAVLLKYAASPHHLSYLWEKYLQLELPSLKDAIAAIQSRCGFYNHEIYQYVQKLEGKDDFIDQFYKNIDKAIDQIQKNPELRQEDKEDRLTVEIVGLLCSYGYNASHDTKIGGHVDIAVEKNNLIWLGEAKIYKDNNYLWEGFQQLATRYSIGDSNQSSGGLLIYIFDKDAKSVMHKWQAYLLSKQLPDYNCRPCESGSLAFISSHKHQRSGLPFHVKHIPVSLHFSPQDRSGRRSSRTK